MSVVIVLLTLYLIKVFRLLFADGVYILEYELVFCCNVWQKHAHVWYKILFAAFKLFSRIQPLSSSK